jgi:hypothetical protein
MRCKEPSTVHVNGYDFCDKHGKQAAKDVKIQKADDTALPSEAVIAELITPIKTEYDATNAKLDGLIIQNQAMLNLVSDILKKVKSDFKELEKQRKSVTKPMLDAKQQVDSWFKPAADALKECESKLKEAISQYLQKQERKKFEAVRDGNAKELALSDAPEIPEGIQTRARWVYEIYDEKLLPREFLCPDHEEIGRVVGEFKDKTDIPGVEVRLDTSIAVRTG